LFLYVHMVLLLSCAHEIIRRLIRLQSVVMRGRGALTLPLRTEIASG